MKRFVWPSKPQGVEILSSFELGSDNTWDERTIQVLGDEQGPGVVGIYKESRRGRLDDETVIHEGFAAEKEEMRVLKEAIDVQNKAFLEEKFRFYDQKVGQKLGFLANSDENPVFLP